MIKIRCVVERITYQSPETGYTVLKCAVKNYNDLVTVVGNLVDANVGSVLLIDGNWKVDAKYGRQFLAESWEETMPATVFGIEKYLGSGLIKGVGPKFAKKIVQQFSTDTLEIIETDVQRLLEVPGIGKKRVDKIAKSWERQKEIKNVMLFLQDHGVSTAFAAKIYRQYGNESIPKVKENPFRLADDIWGIGFKTADSIAMKLGIGKEAFIRLRSGIMYTLSELADEGHVYAERDQLIKKASALLEAEDTSIIMTMNQMLKDEELIREKIMVPQFAPDEIIPEDAAKEIEKECIYLPPFYFAEVGVANKLKKLSAEPAADRLWVSLMKARQNTGNPELSVDVEKIQKAVNMEYDEVQAEAIRRAATAKVLVLTGGPGTGKTTTTQGIIAAYRTFGLNILLAAPTGRAAKRMTEATGLEAKTIHRLLEFKPPEGYQKNEKTPLEGDVLIVDECSMIDIVLMNALMKAIPPHMRLILVGDIDQLPSVGAGNVLRDVIDSEVFPVVRLTRIFRQAQTSRIIMNAHKINSGQMPDTSNGKNTDFFFMTQENPEEAVKKIVELVQKNLPRYYKTPASQIQVLTPMQRGVVGAANLNMALQEALNPHGEGLRRSGFVYRPNDKVMQIKNNYDKEIFNGDIGIIESVDMQDRTLLVNFDGRSIEYDATELDELVHAYATTIHKAQGSEYLIVVIPVLMNHYVMLQRNLLYTGITRAKKILVMVGTKKALSYAVRNVTVTKRNTLLKERLTGEIQARKSAKVYYPEFGNQAAGVQSSKFITEKKSKELITKLEKLCCRTDAAMLSKYVFIVNRPKTENETVYYNVDYIHTAIYENKEIKFHYAEWTVKKELKLKKDGAFYVVSPWALTWDDENYYLVAYDAAAGIIKHYRVDKMQNTEILETDRKGEESFKNFDLAAFAKKTFGMYGGVDAEVTLECRNELAGVVIDRFGHDVWLIPQGEDHFKTRVLVSVSPQFFGWVTGIGSGMRITGPESVKADYAQYLKNIIANYEVEDMVACRET